MDSTALRNDAVTTSVVIIAFSQPIFVLNVNISQLIATTVNYYSSMPDTDISEMDNSWYQTARIREILL